MMGTSGRNNAGATALTRLAPASDATKATAAAGSSTRHGSCTTRR